VQAPAAASAPAGALVGVAQFTRDDARGPPVAVGRMAIDAGKIGRGVTKGKAVIVLHTWKDQLWAIGSKGDPPEAVPVSETGGEGTGAGDGLGGAEGDDVGEGADAPPADAQAGQGSVGDHPAEKKDGPDAGPEEKLTPEGNRDVPQGLNSFSDNLMTPRGSIQMYLLVYEPRSCRPYERLSPTCRPQLSRCPRQLYTRHTYSLPDPSRGHPRRLSTSSTPRSSRSPPSCTLPKKAACSN